MTRISTLCVVTGTLVVIALANGASAFTLIERTTTPKITVRPPVKPNISNTAKTKSTLGNLPQRGTTSNYSATHNLPAVQSQQ